MDGFLSHAMAGPFAPGDARKILRRPFVQCPRVCVGRKVVWLCRFLERCNLRGSDRVNLQGSSDSTRISNRNQFYYYAKNRAAGRRDACGDPRPAAPGLVCRQSRGCKVLCRRTLRELHLYDLMLFRVLRLLAGQILGGWSDGDGARPGRRVYGVFAGQVLEFAREHLHGLPSGQIRNT